MKRLIVVVMAVALAGCGRGKDDLNAWMTQQVREMKRGIAPLPEIKSFPMPSYAQESLKSPFDGVRFVPDSAAESRGGGIRPDQDRQREPLEAYPLESLKFVGVLQKRGVSYALIQADKTVYQIKTGNFLGQNFGVVAKISDYELSLRELVQDNNGEWVERTSTLMLQEQESKK